MKTTLLTSITALLGLLCSFGQAPQDARQLLHDAEISRGVLPANGLKWTVYATSVEGGESDTAKLIVRAKGPHALAEIVEPADDAGKKYLLTNGDMYFYRPGASRPVKVPRRNRVAGDAAIGDIASTSFLAEYEIASVAPGEYQGEACTIFELRGKPAAHPSYARIQLWVSNDKRVSRKAEFYTASGKQLRTAIYDHDSSVTVGGKKIPFLSGLQVVELLGGAKTTTLKFASYEITSFPDAMFDVKAMATP